MLKLRAASSGAATAAAAAAAAAPISGWSNRCPSRSRDPEGLGPGNEAAGGNDAADNDEHALAR